MSHQNRTLKTKDWIDYVKENIVFISSSFVTISAFVLGITYFIYFQIEAYYFSTFNISNIYIEFDLYNFIRLLSIFFILIFTIIPVPIIIFYLIKYYLAKETTKITYLFVILFPIMLLTPWAGFYISFIDSNDILNLQIYVFALRSIPAIMDNIKKSFTLNSIRSHNFYKASVYILVILLFVIPFFYKVNNSINNLSKQTPEILSSKNLYYLDSNLNFCKVVRKYNNKIICQVNTKDQTSKTNVVLINSDNIAQISFEQIDPLKSDDVISAIKIVRTKSAKPDLNNEAFNLYYRNICTTNQKVDLPKKNSLIPKEDPNLSFVNSIIPKIKTEDNLYLISKGEVKYLVDIDESTKAQINKQIEQYKQAGCKEALAL